MTVVPLLLDPDVGARAIWCYTRGVIRIFSLRLRLAANDAMWALIALHACALQTPLSLAAASEWPQLLGPRRDGSYSGPPLAPRWERAGPPVVWKRHVGKGFSGPAVSGDRMILFHRVGDRAVVECLESRTGRDLWKADYVTDYRDDFGFDPGPRATPAIADGRVFTFGAEGRLNCWKFDDGKLLWSVDTAADFESRKGYFGRACSPLVEGDVVILTVGGQKGAGIVAFDVASGRVKWTATGDEVSYSSPTAVTIRGKRVLLALTREALVALNPADGKLIFRHPWRPPEHASVTAATPLVVDDLIFVSASYRGGASLFRFQESGPDLIWQGDDSLSNHYATSVYHNGFLYGWHGRQEQGCELRCVEMKSGKVRWTEHGFGAGTVTLAGNELLVLTEAGRLLRAPATPAGFKLSANVEVLPAPVRAFPALADGLFFVRNEDELRCLDLGRSR